MTHASQLPHPQAPRYATPELIPQGVQLSQSPSGRALFIAFTNPQQPRYGMGLTSMSQPPIEAIIPGQGPIDRGY